MQDNSRKPNVLFIMADQFRHDFLAAAGSTWLKTPNLDRLAARGVRFTQCTTNSPVCAPARIALATGLAPATTGALGNSDVIPAEAPTMYQHFRDHNYRVGCVGKLDLRKPDPYNGRYGDRPCAYGFGFTHPQECEGKMHAGNGTDQQPLGPYNWFLKQRGELQAFHEDYMHRRKQGWFAAAHDSILPTEAFQDEYIACQAVQWLNTVPLDFPFYYFVSFVGPHDPFDPPTEYAQRWRDAELPPPVPISQAQRSDKYHARTPMVTDKMSQAEIAHARRQYAALVEHLDDRIGDLIQALDNRSLTDNTIIVFTSDHGEMLGDHALFTKSVPYEGAVRVPLLLAGPTIPSGLVSNAVVEMADLNPTLAELAGLPQQPNLDAKAFTAVLAGSAVEHRQEALISLHSFNAIRSRELKFVRNSCGTLELYDLCADPHEQANLAAAQPELAAKLAAQLDARLRCTTMPG